MSDTSAPRLRCREKSNTTFYGTYKGHSVTLERDHETYPWAFLIVAPDGGVLADGYTKGPCMMQEAILYALKASTLWSGSQPA